MAPELASLDGGRTELSDDALSGLGENGRVLKPDDAGYLGIRKPFNAMHTSQPGLVIQCSSTADVVDGVNFARENGLLVAIRGGGHSIAGLSSTDGGLLLDLAPLNSVEVDPDARTVKAGGGAIWGEVDAEAQKHGLATPGGVVSDTGIAGLTLGGGYGWLRRKHGLSCDNLVEVEVVGADGEVRTASDDENPDLFWAIRGGGGNFGVVTSFTFRLHEVGPEVAFNAVMYPIEDLENIMKGWRSYVEQAPNEVTSVIVTITFPANPEMPEAVHDRAVAIVGGVFAGDVEEGMRVMQPLRELGEPLFDMSGPTPFTEVQSGFDALFPRNALHAYWKSTYLDELSDDAIATIASRAQDRPAPLTLVNTFHMGGAINDTDAEATAFSERSSPYMISIDGMWDDPSMSDDGIAWVRDAYKQISKFGTGAVYLNFTGLSDEAASANVDSAFGRNLARLGEIKAKYDPENLFRVNNNIEPA
jgi:FAD/FMN-containing dehydrogenase